MKIEALENSTPEFLALSEAEKTARRALLCIILEGLVNHDLLGLTEEQAAEQLSKVLEFHLTGKVESIPVLTKEEKNSKSKKSSGILKSACEP